MTRSACEWHGAHWGSAEESHTREQASVVAMHIGGALEKRIAFSVETSLQSDAANDRYRRKYHVLTRVRIVPIKWELVNVYHAVGA